nr:hemagglutinin repeat-containing protein [Erwinia rhapontici]
MVSAENTQSLDGKNESHGASVGVGINFGQGANGATHSETTVNAGNNLSITSGRDATLHGAQVSGEKVGVNPPKQQ